MLLELHLPTSLQPRRAEITLTSPAPSQMPFCSVTPLRDARAMQVIEQARERGYELEERPLAGQWVWGWRRGDDIRHPCFLTEREALSYMRDRLTRMGAFE
jgi:hypothetical protein